jgi:hypothetical protein
MKTNIIITLLFWAIPFCINAQNLLPSTISYCYSVYTDEPNVQTHTIINLGDTLINGRSCIILDGPQLFGFDLRYLAFEGNQVYRYSRSTEQFYLLYDFDLIPGDILSINLNYNVSTEVEFSDTIAHFRIENLYGIDINGETALVQEISPLGEFSLLTWGTRLIQGIGSEDYILPYSQGQEIYVRLSEAVFENGSNYLEQLCFSSAEELFDDNAIQIYPNPISAGVNVEINAAIGIDDNFVAHISNSQGQGVRTVLLNENRAIETANLPTGVYFVQLQNGMYFSQAKKLIIK